MTLVDYLRYVLPAKLLNYSPRLTRYVWNVLDHTDNGLQDPFHSIESSIDYAWLRGYDMGYYDGQALADSKLL